MTRHATARLAGFLYFATVPTVGFAYGYITFLPKTDPASLITALQSARSVLPWTILLGALGFVDYLVIAALFHRLLAHAGKVAADVMVLFVTASVPLALAPAALMAVSMGSEFVFMFWLMIKGAGNSTPVPSEPAPA